MFSRIPSLLNGLSNVLDSGRIAKLCYCWDFPNTWHGSLGDPGKLSGCLSVVKQHGELFCAWLRKPLHSPCRSLCVELSRQLVGVIPSRSLALLDLPGIRSDLRCLCLTPLGLSPRSVTDVELVFDFSALVRLGSSGTCQLLAHLNLNG